MKSFEKQVLTNQQIFDKVLAHLLKQGKRAVMPSDLCAYRAPDGSKCAAGCLIDDEHYDSKWEGRSVTYEPVSAALEKSGVDPQSLPLVQSLQLAHDDALRRGIEPWLRQMQYITGWYGLEMRSIDEMLRINLGEQADDETNGAGAS